MITGLTTASSDRKDVFDSATRSRVMSRIRSKDTAPELRVRRALWHAGYRYRLHVADLPGRPDIVLGKHHMAIFVHGCFWHGHGCRRFHWPRTNAAYWRAKIERNMERDRQARERLALLGWDVRTVWTCELDEAVSRLLAELRAGGPGNAAERSES